MKVLVVDDERRLVQALQRGLTAEGFTVDTAHDGITGQALAESGEFDVIVLDIMMPGRDGYQVCKRLRDQGITTPILMLTAKDSQADEIQGLRMGADDYLTKPFHYLVLVERLRALARRAGTLEGEQRPTSPQPTKPGFAEPRDGGAQVSADDPLTVGDLQVFPEQRRVVRAGKEVHLTTKEFDILLHLARLPDTVVSKESLIDAAWDFAAPADTNVVEVHVSSLRRKIDAPFPTPLLRTVRGAGYRLSSQS